MQMSFFLNTMGCTWCTCPCIQALAAQQHIESEAVWEGWDSALSPHVGVIGVMIYRHRDDGAWWRSGGSWPHLGLIRFTWVPADPHLTSHWVSMSDQYICQSTCWQSCPFTFCSSCGYTPEWVFRLHFMAAGEVAAFPPSLGSLRLSLLEMKLYVSGSH